MAPIIKPTITTQSGKTVCIVNHLPKSDKNGNIYTYEDHQRMRNNIENTAAGQAALNLANKEGNISAKDFNAYVKTHYPHVQYNALPEGDTINVYNATNSFTTYAIKEETYQKARQRKQLQNSGEKPNHAV